MLPAYRESDLTADDVQQHSGYLLLDFGQSTCGYCMAAAGMVDMVVSEFPQISHVRVSDGRGKRLGRSFKVKLWPTLILIKDGVEVERHVRPNDAGNLRESLKSKVSSQD